MLMKMISKFSYPAAEEEEPKCCCKCFFCFTFKQFFFAAEMSVLHLKLTKTTAQVWYEGSPSMSRNLFIHVICLISTI